MNTIGILFLIYNTIGTNRFKYVYENNWNKPMELQTTEAST